MKPCESNSRARDASQKHIAIALAAHDGREAGKGAMQSNPRQSSASLLFHHTTAASRSHRRLSAHCLPLCPFAFMFLESRQLSRPLSIQHTPTKSKECDVLLALQTPCPAAAVVVRLPTNHFDSIIGYRLRLPSPEQQRILTQEVVAAAFVRA